MIRTTAAPSCDTQTLCSGCVLQGITLRPRALSRATGVDAHSAALLGLMVSPIQPARRCACHAVRAHTRRMWAKSSAVSVSLARTALKAQRGHSPAQEGHSVRWRNSLALRTAKHAVLVTGVQAVIASLALQAGTVREATVRGTRAAAMNALRTQPRGRMAQQASVSAYARLTISRSPQTARCPASCALRPAATAAREALSSKRCVSSQATSAFTIAHSMSARARTKSRRKTQAV